MRLLESERRRGSKWDVNNRRRYGYDVLRVLCALTVCLYHYECSMASVIGGGSVSTGISGLLRNLFGTGLDAGSLAVCLFFMLSGALTAEKTLGDEEFTASGYIRSRLSRLLPPLWLSWLVLCVWFLSRGILHFSVPAWRFIFTVLGLDGYVSYGLDLGRTFYLCGEWFYGAIVIAALIWPAARALYRKMGRWLALGIVLGFEMVALVLLRSDSVMLWRSIPVCFASYMIGAVISDLSLTRSPRRVALCSLAFCSIGLIPSFVPVALRLQLLSSGAFLLIELREQRAGEKTKDESGEICRFHRVLVRLSGMTLYFFMYQHEIIRWAVPIAGKSIDYSFGAFDYVGLAVVIVLITLFAAIMTQSLERRIRAYLS